MLHPRPNRTRDKTAFLALEKNVKKSLTFLPLADSKAVNQSP
jgi:hypothetical protein